jgi:hypothetical protein
LQKHPFSRRIPIVTTGHSLGAGIAVIAALLLREQQFLSFCVGIATPACLSPNLAAACSQYAVSLVNRVDIVPRLSECALYNLSSNERVCAANKSIASLLTPGTVFWMREPVANILPRQTPQKPMEIVQLKVASEFTQSIVMHYNCLAHHNTQQYAKSIDAVDSRSPYDLTVIDFSTLFVSFPDRKIEPEFLLLTLPKNIANALRDCINSSTQFDQTEELKRCRDEFKQCKKELRESRNALRDCINEGKQINQTDELKRCREEFKNCKKELQATLNDTLKQYSALLKERNQLQAKVDSLTK